MRPKLLYKNSLAVAAMALAFLLAANSAFAQGTRVQSSTFRLLFEELAI